MVTFNEYVKDILNQIKKLKYLGFKHFWFVDSLFNIPDNYASNLCKRLIETGLNQDIKWSAYASPLCFNKRLAETMKNAGCIGGSWPQKAWVWAILKR